MDSREAVRNKIAELLGRESAEIMDTAVLTDLVNNSFALVETVIELQEEFDVRFHQSDMNGATDVGQLLDLVTSRMSAPASN